MLDIRPIPVQTWTHSPVRAFSDGCIAETSLDLVTPDGWRITAAYMDGPRCGVKHPETPNGSCGAQPGHEHPHVWAWDNAIITSVSRKTKISV